MSMSQPRYLKPFFVGGVAVGVWFLLTKNPDIEAALSGLKGLLLTIFTLLLATPLWIAYGRCNGLDSTEGLRPAQAVKVQEFAFGEKKALLTLFLVALAALATCAVLWLASRFVGQYANGFRAAALVVFGVALVVSLFDVVNSMLRIERALKNVGRWRAEQKERQKQVDELREARAESKLVPDAALLSYRSLQADEADDANSDKAAEPAVASAPPKASG